MSHQSQRSRTGRCLLLFLLCMPGILRAQASPDPRLAGRLDSVTLGRVELVIGDAAGEGLPTEPLIQKALEGAAKGASGDQIVSALHALGAAMARSRDALGEHAAERDILAGALSLRIGATPAMLSEVAQAGRGRSLDVPLGVLTDLVAQGLPLERAYESVERLMRLGASDGEFVALRDRLTGSGAALPRPLPVPRPAHPAGAPAAGAPQEP